MKPYRLFITLLICLAAPFVRADDVGITETRLIEESANHYALEVDISPYLVDSIRAPVLPKRGTFTANEERVDLGQMLVIRYRFSTGERPLGPRDQLLLPWQRTGAVVTAHWLDGKSTRAFFDRDLTGIPVSIRSLRSEELSRKAILQISVSDAFSYLGKFGWLHLLLITACAARGSFRRTMGLLFAFAGGHGLSLIATDLGVPGVSQSFVAIVMAVASILLFADAFRRDGAKQFWPVLLMLGLLQGLCYSAPADVVVARFGFNTVIDLVQIGAGLFIGPIFSMIKPREHKVLIYAGGALAATALMMVFPEALKPIQTDGVYQTSFTAVSTPGNATRTVSRPVELKDLVSGFVTITPFEIRSEWLIRAGDFLSFSSAQPAELKADVLNRITSAMELRVDGDLINPGSIRADFVSVGTYGVTTRSDPPADELVGSVIGVTLAYAVDDAPQAVSIQFQPLENIEAPIPVGVSDPWGSTPHTLTASDSTIQWACPFAGFRRPVIPAVEIHTATWPLVSVVLLIAAGIFVRRNPRSAIILCGAAMLLYPFIRTPAMIARAPTEAHTQVAIEQLLTNIYRAFDYRTEEAIYDRLAISATGDQLAEIYLEQMRAMELENRGGARASVDNVEVQAIRTIRPTAEGMDVDSEWLVSGSVSHFGHTHYRKNRYAAILTLVDEKGVWKIGGIEIKEEERVL